MPLMMVLRSRTGRIVINYQQYVHAKEIESFILLRWRDVGRFVVKIPAGPVQRGQSAVMTIVTVFSRFMVVDGLSHRLNLAQRRWPVLRFFLEGPALILGLTGFFAFTLFRMQAFKLPLNVWQVAVLVLFGAAMAMPVWTAMKNLLLVWYQSTMTIDEDGIRQRSWRGERFLRWGEILSMEEEMNSWLTLHAHDMSMKLHLPQFESADDAMEYIVTRWWRANPSVFAFDGA